MNGLWNIIDISKEKHCRKTGKFFFADKDAFYVSCEHGSAAFLSRRFKTPPTNYAMIISELYKPPLLNINAYNMFNRPIRGRTRWIDFHSKYKAMLHGDSPTDDFCILRVCRGLWIKRFSMAIREGAVEESLFLFLWHFSLGNISIGFLYKISLEIIVNFWVLPNSIFWRIVI